MKEREAEEREVARSNKQSTTVQGKASEEMFLAKAEMMKQNATLGNIELVEKQLTLLERFKTSFVKVQQSKGQDGELEYDKTATSLLQELPFMQKRSAVEGTAAASSKRTRRGEVIAVNDDDEDEDDDDDDDDDD
jgi:hypothetical protein